MRFLHESSEAEMIAEFLRQEFASSARYGANLNRCVHLHNAKSRLLTHPDLHNAVDNTTRRRILGCFRGYGEGRSSFFTNFPDAGVTWQWMQINRDELLSTRLIRYCAEPWKGCRSPREVARMIRNGDIPDSLKEDGTMGRIEVLVTAVRTFRSLPPLLLVSADEGQTRVVMEGNTRLIVYALAEEALPQETTILIGYFPLIARWDEY